MAYILDELPLCQALAFWRAKLRRTDPEDTRPGFEDEEMIDTKDDAMRAEIKGYIRQAKQESKRRKQ